MAARKIKQVGHEERIGVGVGLSKAHGFLSSNDGGSREQLLEFRRFDSEPTRVDEAQRQCRKWHGDSLFLGAGLKLKAGFLNWGFKIKPIDKIEGKGRKEFREWLRRAEKGIHHFVRETWEDYLLMDVAVAFWRETAPVGMKRVRSLKGKQINQVFTLPPEDCQYSDGMGIEVLKVKLNLTHEERAKLPDHLKKRYGSGREVKLDESEGEYFRVLKRARTGKGFGMPRLRSLFRAMKTEESLQVADNLWGYFSRLALRQTKVGHEIRNGPHAGKPLHFWTKKKSDAVQKFMEGRQGAADWVTNFDFEVVYPFPSLDRFDKKKYEGVFQRMATWLGPAGLLLMGGAKSDADIWMRMLMAEVNEDRRDVALHCDEVINLVFDPPVPVRVEWGNKIFMDSRLAMELGKTLLSQGALSQTTGLERAGEDVDVERERKQEEGELLQDEATKWQVLPIYDPSHGNRPGEVEGAKGRPVGAKGKG